MELMQPPSVQDYKNEDDSDSDVSEDSAGLFFFQLNKHHIMLLYRYVIDTFVSKYKGSENLIYRKLYFCT